MGRFVVLFVLLGILAGAAAQAGPEARVGETRYTYLRATVLRSTMSAVAKPVVTLPAATALHVLEVQAPSWLRVEARMADGGPQTGWLRAFETMGAAAAHATNQPNAQGAYRLGGAGSGAIDARDVAAAGRQFDAATEARYRAGRADLAQAYAQVDEMERATEELRPVDAVAFIVYGGLGEGRQGQGYDRPGRLPGDPPLVRRGGSLADGIGRLRDLGRKNPFGNPIPPKAEDVADAAQKFGAVIDSVRDMQTKPFTAQQKYYLGRAVAANAIAKHGLDRSNEARRRYVRLVGDAIVRLSPNVPPNFGGYHFDVLSSPEINAISGPGGFVLITSGAVEACRTEDELAAILYHELAHVAADHGERTLRAGKDWQNRIQATVQALGAAGLTDDRVVGEITRLFSGAVTDMVRTSTEHSYGSALEFEADQWALGYLSQAAYDVAALRDVLQRLAHFGHAHGGATHAPPAVRAAQVTNILNARYAGYRLPEGVAERRAERFGRILGRGEPTPGR